MDTRTIAERIQSEQPSRNSAAYGAAKVGLLDYLASSLLAEGEPELSALCEAYGFAGFSGICTEESCPAAWKNRGQAGYRALYNGFRAHLLDIDDTHGSVRGHPGAVILSALFAAADGRTSGRDFLDAHIIGTEVMARLGHSLNQEHYLRGWHNTATLGAVAAAAAVSRLRHFDVDRTAACLGTAATQSAGLRAQFGTPVKALHVGFAARAGAEAALLTEAGVLGDPDVLFKRYGFYQVLGPLPEGEEKERKQEESWRRPWGESWEIAEPGLWLKRYPFCSAAMAGCDAAAQLTGDGALAPDEVERVEIGFFPGKDAALCAREPKTGEQGRFSAEYIVWLGLTGRGYSFGQFSPEPIPEEIRSELTRVRRVRLAPDGGSPYTRVTVWKRDGSVRSAQVAHPKGSPENPLRFEDEEKKLAMAVADDDQRARILAAVRGLEKGTLRELFSSLKP